MTQKERAQALEGRILDHLMAEGFRDDQLRVRTAITYDHQVIVSLHPRQFGCAPCSEKGLLAKFLNSVKMDLGVGQWCSGCRKAYEQYLDRNSELMPRLKVLLERAFGVREVTPGHPGSDVVIAP
jgi:hypothetical protein